MKLTERQIRILQLLVEGNPIDAIAEHLVVKPNAIYVQVSRMRAANECGNNFVLTARALAAGLVRGVQ